MDKELFEGLIKHIKEHGVRSTGIVTIVSSDIVLTVGNLGVELRLNGTKDIIFGTIEWDNYIWVSDVSNDNTLGNLHEDEFMSRTNSYTYRGFNNLEDIINRLVSDYREAEYKKEQEELERKTQEELLEDRVNNFLYKG